MLSHRLIHLFVNLLLAALTCVSPLAAMTFTLIEPIEFPGYGPRPNHMILGSGPIMQGDAQVFEAFMARLPPTDIAEVQWGIALNSPGGSLAEGVRLGEVIRKHVVTTVVLNGHSCESACAVAFLGGAASYTTSLGVMRLLQPGGRLGYHGIAVEDDRSGTVNETLDLARATNAFVRDYAVRMGDVDDGLVQRLFNTPPEEMAYIDTPAGILGLKVTLLVEDLRAPDGWAVNVCRHAVSDMLHSLDPLGVDERVSDRAERIGSVEAFRRALLEEKHNDGSGLGPELYQALARAEVSTAINLLAGQPLFFAESRIDIWKVGLGRGAGFYYDTCFAVANDSTLQAVVVDGVGESSKVEIYEMLHGFPADAPLW